MVKRLSNKFDIGKAGEYLVCAELTLKGVSVSIAAETLPYDLLVDNGKKILKVQVKTTEIPRLTNQWRGNSEAYVFSIKRKGSNGEKKYEDNEVDLFALVCLDTLQIGYLKNCDMPTTINIRVDSLKGTYHDEKGFKVYKNIVKLKQEGKSVKEIMEIVNLSQTSVRNYLKDDFKPFKTKSLYMSNLARDLKWFENF
jgi:hypothetical protein